MAARSMERILHRPLMHFYGISNQVESEDRQRLLDNIARRQLAGIILAAPSWSLAGTPITDAPDLPRVELSSGECALWPVIRTPKLQWLPTALDWLAERKRQRVAFLFFNLEKVAGHEASILDRALAERGMVSPAYLRQAPRWHDLAAVNHCVQLLMRAAPGERPDALIITDDNLIEGAVEGLITAGARVSEEIDVVALANFPLHSEPVLPIRLLAYDQREVLRQAVELIDRQRRREKVPPVTKIPILWQESIETAG